MTSPVHAFTDPVSGSRIYAVGNKRYYSVTTILSEIPKQLYLVPWAAKCAAEVAAEMVDEYLEGKESGWDTMLGTFFAPLETVEDEHGAKTEYIFDPDAFASWVKRAPEYMRDTAGELGDEVHDLASELLKVSSGNPDIYDVVLDAYFEEDKVRGVAYKMLLNLGQWLRENEVRVVASEFTVFNDTHQYAGQCDLAAVVNGVPMFLDIKTGRISEENAMQIAAYSRGEYVVQDNGDLTDMPLKEYHILTEVHGGVLDLNETKLDLREVDISDEVFDCFLAYALIRRLWTDGAKKEAKGKVLWTSKPKKTKEEQ